MSSKLELLAATVDRLGAECPWTAAQKSEDMMHYLRKECLEVEEVLLGARSRPVDKANLTQELGDVLFDVLLLIRVSARDHGIDLESCCTSAVEKIERRCPYLSDPALRAATASDATRLWSQAKLAEQTAGGCHNAAESRTHEPCLASAQVVGTAPVECEEVVGARAAASISRHEEGAIDTPLAGLSEWEADLLSDLRRGSDASDEDLSYTSGD
ncbi:hypothetical protein AB1Y20_010784 [Prymnesium parvum]|uniref:NTP pyrophosphohydrolase MazG-like domain-containing protein n=1 Tax=Prymnesium parvum TaxID=97485 RepID=A0AB34IRY9_PRYPA